MRCGWPPGRRFILELLADPLYRGAVVNTLVFVALGVNIKMFGALLLSGFFMRRDWWVRALLVFYILPWLVAATLSVLSRSIGC